MLWLPNKTSNYPSEWHAARRTFEPVLSVPQHHPPCCWCGVLLQALKLLYFLDGKLALTSTAFVVRPCTTKVLNCWNQCIPVSNWIKHFRRKCPGQEMRIGSSRTDCTFGTACQVPCCVVQYCKMLSRPTMPGIQTVNPLNKSLVQSVFMMNSE